jgi:hypothetical protein
MSGQTLEQWIANNPRAIVHRRGNAVGVVDSRDIEQNRTWLYGLSDYVVSSLSGGTHWLIPRETKSEQA